MSHADVSPKEPAASFYPGQGLHLQALCHHRAHQGFAYLKGLPDCPVDTVQWPWYFRS